MKKFIDFLKGKKTYIVVIVAVLISAAQAAGYIGPVPEFVWTGLGALGLGAVRDAVNKVGK
jgi:hypothetical protein